ncbi:MAG: sodium:alanine symporter family protein [Paludibacteraceae bacterium]|nr:sodium:alanine symporter family protein [Paludibacteraceae bacterium]MBP6283793.1 sodium:alanine symporter family protein [Paludibacteraceae bacterium]
MKELLSFLESFFEHTNAFLWGAPMIILLFGTHLFLTVRTGFVQRKIFTAIKLSFTSDKDSKGDISQFGALVIALAATIGTGNIIGIATAIALGGPGAVFWCWLTGVFGMATKYSESLLAVKYRIKTDNGKMMGGAMVVLDKVLHMRWLAVLFCIFTAIAAFGIGNMTQANSISILVEQNFAIPPYITGIVLASTVGIVMFGGVEWVARVCKALVPSMALLYIIGCLWLLGLNYQFVGAAVSLILRSAFSSEALGGGFTGAAVMMSMRYGIARGLFSNESGLGSAPIVAAAAQTKNAVRQALISATGTFWDTVVICALTGIVLVSSVLAFPDIDSHDGALLTSMAFSKLHVWGSSILTFGLLTFVFSTLLGWSYYAERTLEYLFSSKIIVYYRVAWILAIFFGSILKISLVWNISDSANALMAIPNLVMVLMLSGVVASETRKYLWSNNLDQTDSELMQ